METLVVSIIGLFLCAITWVAYAHPRQYRESIFPFLQLLVVCALVAGFAYSTGLREASMVTYDINLVHDLSLSKAISEIRTAIDARQPPFSIFIGSALFYIYLTFLSLLEAIRITKQAPPPPPHSAP